jgi:hypothetical protein
MGRSSANAALIAAFLTTALLGTIPGLEAKETPAKQAGSLHRMDFRVEGASCVACLRRTGQELRSTKGVIKADVSIFRPYWAIVIYDASQTNLEKMKRSITNEHVKLMEVEDKPIAEVPLIVIPKSVGMQPGAPEPSASQATGGEAH